MQIALSAYIDSKLNCFRTVGLVTGTFVQSSIGGTFVPGNFRSLEASFAGTFFPMTNIKGELSLRVN